MADKIFNIKLLQNVDTEAHWLASSYAIRPNEQVFAIVTKTVTEDGNSKTVNFIRSKINTASEAKIFSELEYSDEYITLNLDAISTELAETTMTANMNKTLIGQLKTDLEEKIDQSLTSIYKPMGSITDISALPAPSATTLGQVFDVAQDFTTTDEFLEGAGVNVPANSNVAIVSESEGVYKYDVIGSVVDLTNYYDKDQTEDKIDSAIDLKLAGVDLDQIATNKENVETLQTTVGGLTTDVNGLDSDVTTLKGDMTQAKTNISNLQSDVNTAVGQVEDLQTTVNGLETDVSSLESSLGGKMPISGGTFTGNVNLPAITGTPADTRAATVKYVKDYVADNSGGDAPSIILSASQPAAGTQTVAGSLWFKILS